MADIKFKHLKWATSNKDSTFYYADTIRLLQVRAEKGPVMNFADYFGADFVILDFYKKKKFRKGNMIIDGWVQSSIKKDYEWDYNKEDNILTLQVNNSRVDRFSIESIRQVQIKTVFIHDDIPTIELLLVRRKR